MSVESLLTIAVIGIALYVAWRLDRRAWARRSVDELQRMASGSDWRGWRNGMVELRRRNHDVHQFIPGLLANLFHASQFSREAARVALVDTFAELRDQLKAYRATDPPDLSRQKLSEVLQQHGVAV